MKYRDWILKIGYLHLIILDARLQGHPWLQVNLGESKGDHNK